MKLQRMLGLGALTCFLTIGNVACAQAGDEAAVRAAWSQEADGWIKHDAKAVAAMYTTDAIWQNPFGVRLHGSAELETFLSRLFKRPGYLAVKDTSAAKIKDVRFPSPTVAVVWSEESSEGQIDDSKDGTGKAMAPRHSYYVEVMVKQRGDWKISECLIADELQHPQ